MAESPEEWSRFLPHSDTNHKDSEFAEIYADETVCVAGAGGYIGSALVKALALAKPRRLILLEASEHALFEIQRQMKAETPCEYVLGSVTDRRLLTNVFSRFRPQIVFHAAAFKHVGLLEHQPLAAIENNVLGTHTQVRSAFENGVDRFVLLSTDKAVDPHSIMGVSKRIAELITLSLTSPKFCASAIRLANVIGSPGSVVPIFLDQIANGAPVSVTHPQASRYFLSREQAVTVILAAGAANCGGMVLVPDLAEPVSIADLARFLSKENGTLSFTGLKPGEKLTEDLIGGNETKMGTAAGSLTVVKTRTLSIQECNEAVEELSACLAYRDHSRLIQSLCRLVPEYVPSKLFQ